jgi:hypothetical protein
MELVFFWGAAGSTRAGNSGWTGVGEEGGLAGGWLERMVGASGAPTGSGSNFRDKAFGAAGREEEAFFTGGGPRAGLDGVLAAGGGGEALSGVAAEKSWAGTESMEVTWAELLSGDSG